MQAKYNSFIGMYDNVFPDGYCHHMIQEFERLNSIGVCSTRKQSENARRTVKDDTHCFLDTSTTLQNHTLNSFNDERPLRIFWDSLQCCFNDYTDEYGIIADYRLKSTTVKMQKTDPGSGYHIWHAEQNSGEQAARCLVFSTYLNTLDEGSAGETEFLYQRLRIPPKENTMLIWPAGFTHTHRGNVVYGEKSKYIITGWFYFE